MFNMRPFCDTAATMKVSWKRWYKQVVLDVSPQQKSHMVWCLGMWVATPQEAGQCPIQRCGRCFLRNLRTWRWKLGGAPSCCKMKSSESSYSWGKSHSDSMSRYVVPVTVFSAKKYWLKTRVRDTAQQIFTLRESVSCSVPKCGASVPHVRTLWWFTFPLKWNTFITEREAY